MRRALLAWEGGDGRGHITSLRTIADAIGDRFRFDAALCITTHAAALTGLCDVVIPAPPLKTASPGLRPAGTPPATWGEFLGDVGFGDRDQIAARIAWWQRVMRGQDISLLIADFSPFALLAARGLGIPSVSSGVGYFVPPASMTRFPVLVENPPVLLHDEAAMVTAVNDVAGDFGVPPLTTLPAIYSGATDIVLSPPILDPYRELRTEPHIPPAADFASAAFTAGDEVYGYFSTTEMQQEGIVEGLICTGLPTRLFVPGVDATTAARLEAAGIVLERAPVPVDLIAQRSRVIVNAGQHGILCLALSCGRPQIVLPQHIEHLHNGRVAQRAGVARVLTRKEWQASLVSQAIRDAYGDGPMLRRAVTVAADMAPFFRLNRRSLIRRRLSML